MDHFHLPGWRVVRGRGAGPGSGGVRRNAILSLFDRDTDPSLQVVRRRAGESGSSYLLRRESQFQSSGSEDSDKSRGWNGRRFRRRVRARARGWCAERPDCLFGCRQDEGRNGTGAGRGHQADKPGKSEPEMELLSQVAASMGLTVPVAFRINPDVDAGTHDKITTGRAEDKFGIPANRALDAYKSAASRPGLKVVGIDVHIGSQLTDLAPYEEAFRLVAALTDRLRSNGHEISRLDLGGGLGIPYRRSNDAPPLPVEFCDLVKRTIGHLNCEVEIEPGRLIAGNAGILVTRLLYVKSGEDRNFMILDSAMNDLVRPAMYSSYHEIVSGFGTGARSGPAPLRHSGTGM